MPDHQLCTQTFVLSSLACSSLCARPDKFVGGEPPGPHPKSLNLSYDSPLDDPSAILCYYDEKHHLVPTYQL